MNHCYENNLINLSHVYDHTKVKKNIHTYIHSQDLSENRMIKNEDYRSHKTEKPSVWFGNACDFTAY